jgi:hypothetical protein
MLWLRTVTSRAGWTRICSNPAYSYGHSGEMLMWLLGNLKIDYRESRGEGIPLSLHRDWQLRCRLCRRFFMPGEIAFLSTCRTIVATRLVQCSYITCTPTPWYRLPVNITLCTWLSDTVLAFREQSLGGAQDDNWQGLEEAITIMIDGGLVEDIATCKWLG